jgi:glycosyltransferase involved in cell wall biosynthesis
MLMDLSPRLGHGRVWHRVLGGLAEKVTLEPVTSRPVSSAGVRADVWLADGHGGGIDVEEPVVAAVHEVGWTTRELRRFLDPGFAVSVAAATASAVAAAAHVLAPSEWTRVQVLGGLGVDPDRVHTVPYGVDLGIFAPGLPGGRARVDAATDLGADRYVLFVGSVTPRKNIRAVRHAVARLVRRGFPVVLVVVLADASDRPDTAELRRAGEAELPGAPGRIVSTAGGTDAELAALMSGADAVCMPSFSEGFGLPALEAMACGAPVVVSDRGALPEVVADGGLVVAPTTEEVERGLAQVLSDEELARRLRERGRRRAGAFPWERTVEGWLRVLERAADERS